jgi:hypothetical protein
VGIRGEEATVIALGVLARLPEFLAAGDFGIARRRHGARGISPDRS